MTIDPIAWTATSVDFSNDGTVWIGEDMHFQVEGSQNRLLHISTDGNIVDSISMTTRPNCLRINRNDDFIYMASDKLYSLDPSVLELNEIASDGGFSLTIDDNRDIWIASFSNSVYKFSKNGDLLLTISDSFGHGQKYICTPKNSTANISEKSISNNSFYLYPNPTDSKITFENQIFNNVPFTLIVKDLYGRTLFSNRCYLPLFTFDVSSLNQGI